MFKKDLSTKTGLPALFVNKQNLFFTNRKMTKQAVVYLNLQGTQ